MREACMDKRFAKLISDIQDGEYCGVKFIKKNRLTLSDFRVLECMVQEFLNKGKTGCFQDSVAAIFKKYKFTITPDEHNVIFYIS